MRRRTAWTVLMLWMLVIAGSIWIASSATFPTSVGALVSNLDAVKADRLIAQHFGEGQKQTTLYCVQNAERQAASGESTLTGIVSLDQACQSASSSDASQTVRAVSDGYLSATPRTLILEGIDLARSIREGNGDPTPTIAPSRARPHLHELRLAEAWSLGLTVVALLLCFRSLSAAAMTFAFGTVTVVVTWGGLTLTGQLISIPIVVVSISSLIALALGADLAAQSYRARLCGRRMSKTTVVVACGGVAAVFLPLLAFPPRGLRALAIGVVIASIAAFAGALTLIPAVTTLLGDRFNGQRKPSGSRSSWIPVFVRLSRKSPWIAILVGAAMLLPLAVSGVGNLLVPHSVLPQESPVAVTSVRAEFENDLVRLTKGAIEFVIDAPSNQNTDSYITGLIAGIAARPDFAAPVFVQWSTDKQIAVVTSFIAETGSLNAFRTASDVRAQSDEGRIHTYIGGTVMLGAQIDDILQKWSVWGALAAIVLAFIVLTTGFRSSAIAGALMAGSVVSSLAALGILSWATNRGVSLGPFHIYSQDGLDPWAPLILTCVVIAASTSYASLILGQLRRGAARTAHFGEGYAVALTEAPQLTTAAAVSMIAIGIGFTTSNNSSLQQEGAGLAIALAIQATLVRAILVPGGLELVDRLRNKASRIGETRRLPEPAVPEGT